MPWYANVIPSFCDNRRVSIVDLTVANAVLLATRPSNLQLTPTTLKIQYCYSYSYEILPTCTH